MFQLCGHQPLQSYCLKYLERKYIVNTKQRTAGYFRYVHHIHIVCNTLIAYYYYY
jgi:hypothetical protein